MDSSRVVLLSISVAGVAIFIARVVWLKKHADRARTWPTAEATVQSGEEVVASGRGADVCILCFTFSYVVKGEYYSGRFELLPNLESADAVLSRMKERKIQLHYDPAKPEAYYLPDEQIEGCELNNDD